eukprot:s6283_g1.t1
MVKRAAKCPLCGRTRALREIKKDTLLEAAKAAAKKPLPRRWGSTLFASGLHVTCLLTTVKLCETCATKLSHALTAKRKATGDGDI